MLADGVQAALRIPPSTLKEVVLGSTEVAEGKGAVRRRTHNPCFSARDRPKLYMSTLYGVSIAIDNVTNDRSRFSNRGSLFLAE